MSRCECVPGRPPGALIRLTMQESDPLSCATQPFLGAAGFQAPRPGLPHSGGGEKAVLARETSGLWRDFEWCILLQLGPPARGSACRRQKRYPYERAACGVRLAWGDG